MSSVLGKVGAKLDYDYDDGDGWEHDIVVEAIEPIEQGAACPRLIAGKRACPPGDCGGRWGYQDLLEVLADPNHPDRDERLEWLGDDFDPEHFEIPTS